MVIQPVDLGEWLVDIVRNHPHHAYFLDFSYIWSILGKPASSFGISQFTTNCRSRIKINITTISGNHTKYINKNITKTHYMSVTFLTFHYFNSQHLDTKAFYISKLKKMILALMKEEPLKKYDKMFCSAAAVCYQTSKQLWSF